jgi:hypothetical protein
MDSLTQPAMNNSLYLAILGDVHGHLTLAFVSCVGGNARRVGVWTLRRAARVLPDGQTTRYRYEVMGARVAVEHGRQRLDLERDVTHERFRIDANRATSMRQEDKSMAQRIGSMIVTLAAVIGFGCGGKVAVDGSRALVVQTQPYNWCWAPTNPPEAVYLLVASQSITCAAPTLVMDHLCLETNAQVPTWEACIPLQHDLAPEHLDLQADGNWPTASFLSLGLAVGSPAVLNCISGSSAGSLTITSVQPSSMAFTLMGTNTASGDEDGDVTADGTYDAFRCP